MYTLSLLRHAKSNWTAAAPGEPQLADQDRSLGPRGERDAPQMARWLAANAITPDLILCSSALRTRQTLALVGSHLGPAAATADVRDDLYLADTAHLLSTAQTLPDGVHHVMMIGHDPGFHLFANLLVGAGDRSLRMLLAAKFPTCGAAVIDFQFTRWSLLGPGVGTLRHFMGPKRLPD